MEGPVYSNAGQGAPAQQPGAPTLGQVAQTAQTPSEDDALVQKYGNTLQAVTKMMQPMMMQHATPPPHQSWGHLLGSVLTMGMLPLQEHEQAARYNAYADQHNQALMLHAGGIARELVSADEHGKLEDMMQRLKVLDTEMGMARLQLEIGKDRYKRMRDATEPYANTPEGLSTQADRGLVPSPDFPNRLTQPSGGITLPHAPGGGFAMPGSPLANAGAPTSGAGTEEAPTSDLGEIGRRAQKRKTQAAVEQKTAVDQATGNQQFENSAQNVESYFNSPDYARAIATLYGGPLSSVIGPMGKYLREKKTGGSPEAAYLDMGKTQILPALRALEGGIKNFQLRGGKTLEQIGLTKQFNGLTSGSFTPGQAEQLKSAVLARLTQLRALMKSQNEAPGSPPSTTETPATSALQTQDTSGGTPRRLSSGKLIMEEP